MEKRKIHYYWLDLIRFLAAFLVLACHFRGAFFQEYSELPLEQQNIFMAAFYAITRLGHEAVLVIFALSGFLVGGGTINKLKNGSFSVKSYSIDRFVRITLPLFSALLLFVIANLFMHNPIDWKAWFGNLFSLQGICTYAIIEPLWSLSYEVWFYVLAGAVAVMFMRSKRTSVILSSVLVLLVFIIFNKLSAHYLFVWLMGALAFITMPKKKNNLVLLFSAILMVVMIVALQLTSGSKAYSYSFGISRHSIELLFAFAFCVFMQQIILFEPKNKFTLWLNSFGTKAAEFSYTLYLTHVVVLRVLEYLHFPKASSVNFTSTILYISELTIAMIVAYLVYWCFEKRTFVIKNWIKHRL